MAATTVRKPLFEAVAADIEVLLLLALHAGLTEQAILLHDVALPTQLRPLADHPSRIADQTDLEHSTKLLTYLSWLQSSS